jgi:hypothetical protein
MSTVAAVTVRPAARQQPPAPSAPSDERPVTPAQIQQMFDAVAMVRSQEALKLKDERYLPFLAKYKLLLDTRRRAQQERNRALQELRKLTNDPATDDNVLRDRLRAFQEQQMRSVAEIRKAQEGVDAALDPRQQVRFRLFEDRMEQEKVDLITKARQANRLRQLQNQQRPNPTPNR